MHAVGKLGVIVEINNAQPRQRVHVPVRKLAVVLDVAADVPPDFPGKVCIPVPPDLLTEKWLLSHKLEAPPQENTRLKSMAKQGCPGR